MSNFKTYNPKPFRECAEGLYKPGYSLYFTTWTRDIRIGKEEAFALGWHPKSIFHSAPVLNYQEPLTPPLGACVLRL